MSDLFSRVVVPVASPEDARATCRALGPYATGTVVAVNVIEKGGGTIDKASVEQRQEYAEEIFDVVREQLDDERDVETEIRYGTDVAETVFAAADDHDASAIVLTPRGGSRWIRLLTGDVALDIITQSDRPVVVLPDVDDTNEATEDVGGQAAESEETGDDGGGSA